MDDILIKWCVYDVMSNAIRLEGGSPCTYNPSSQSYSHAGARARRNVWARHLADPG